MDTPLVSGTKKSTKSDSRSTQPAAWEEKVGEQATRLASCLWQCQKPRGVWVWGSTRQGVVCCKTVTAKFRPQSVFQREHTFISRSYPNCCSQCGSLPLFHARWQLTLPDLCGPFSSNPPAKKMNTPYFIEHSMLRNTCPTTKVQRLLTMMFRAAAAARVSWGCTSMGSSHPRGPLQEGSSSTGHSDAVAASCSMVSHVQQCHTRYCCKLLYTLRQQAMCAGETGGNNGWPTAHSVTKTKQNRRRRCTSVQQRL